MLKKRRLPWDAHPSPSSVSRVRDDLRLGDGSCTMVSWRLETPFGGHQSIIRFSAEVPRVRRSVLG
jgi:hypothetical protein